MDMFLLPMKLQRARNGDAEDERGNKPRHSRLLKGEEVSLALIERPQRGGIQDRNRSVLITKRRDPKSGPTAAGGRRSTPPREVSDCR
jgi:hypothetical protein